MMYWHVDASYYPATITAFDELHYQCTGWSTTTVTLSLPSSCGKFKYN